MVDAVKAPSPKVFYYGFNGKGHHLIDADGNDVHREVTTPWGYALDGELCPDGKVLRKDESYQPEGKAMIHQKDGWTALGFWDRSGDSRFNSNSNFLVRGTYTFDEMLALAKAQFPDVFARMGFEVTQIV